jgi:nicotinamide-nucleotide adenylyltransferase
MEHAIYALPQLFALREVLETLDVTAPPTARILYPESSLSLRRVGLLCGSFNPLTLAHTELAERARTVAGLDKILFTLAKVTVDKEQVTGLSLEDRLLLLTLYAQRHAQVGVALVNRGLYFEQAQAFRSLLGPEVELSFIVGMDKLLQILDPKYYRDRDAALQQLFTLTSLIVANRGAMARAAFDELLDQSENCSYRSHISFCLLADEIADVSATTVRERLAAGERVDEFVPEESAAFLAETQAFHPPLRQGDAEVDAYAARLQILETLYASCARTDGEVDFRALLREAIARGG